MLLVVVTRESAKSGSVSNISFVGVLMKISIFLNLGEL